MPSTSLDDLPAELITAILYILASPTALQSLIQASARCYKIFLLSKSDLLLTTLRKVLQPEIKTLVLMVHEGYHLPPFNGSILNLGHQTARDSLDGFVTKFNQYHQLDWEVSYLPTPHFIVPQLRTICTLEYFVEDYSNWVSSHLYSPRPHSLNIAIAMGMLPPPQAHQDLSHVERSRLQRAFLGFEIFCTAMHSAGGHDRPLSAKQSAQRNNNRFLNILQPWEREEWVCILDYLTVRVEDVFDKLELDHVERMTEQFLNGEMDHEMPIINESSVAPTETKPNDLSISIPGTRDPTQPDYETNGGQSQARVDHSTNFFTTNTKRLLHAHYVMHLITMGLPFLRRLFQSPTKKQKRLILDNLNTYSDMANLVAKTWINRQQAQLLRRHGEDEITAAMRRQRQAGAGTVMPANPTAPAAAPTPLVGLFRTNQPTDDNAAENERILTFQGDQLGKPNYAFLWTHGFTSTNVCSGCDYLHRSLGYVFWDQARLEQMGLVERGHGAPNRRKELLKRRRRAEEKSAQERLADMGFVIPEPPKKKVKDEEKNLEEKISCRPRSE
jgi:hypothetical protein